MKQILTGILSALLCLSASTTVFAEEGRTQETDVKTIVVNQDTLNLNATDVKEYAEYGKQLAAVLKGTDNLSVWQVSNWKGWKEASGTSYKAYCSGNFHWGIEYGGTGIVIQDYYCKNTLTCSKNGTITKSTTMS